MHERPSEAQLQAWCEEHLGSPIEEVLFRTDHLSTAIGCRLRDDRRVVLKLRSAAERIHECFAIQRHLWQNGFPCPRPLAEPTDFGSSVMTAEELVDNGAYREGTQETARIFAAPLARQVLTSSTYNIRGTLPAPPWLGWDHEGTGIWPEPDDLALDLNEYADAWLDSIAERVARVLRSTEIAPVIGHADWHPGNLRWGADSLLVAYDWDSLALLPEAAIAGGASVLYTHEARACATVEESAAFLDAYSMARGRAWSAEETHVSWAAGLWNLAFDAKKQTLDGIGGSLASLERDADRRLELAGL
jgi:hypothetical protein